MEHSLLTPHNITLKKQGIPYSRIRHLAKGKRYYDANLQEGFSGDDDLKEIHAMEDSLQTLSPEQVDLRVIADFCCIWRYDYPQRVHDICAIIGGDRKTALRLHYQVCTRRREEFISYATALKGWLTDRPPDDAGFFNAGSGETVKKVYGFLGKKDPLKAMLAERTYIGFSNRVLNCTFWGTLHDQPEVNLYPCHAQQLPDGWPGRMSELEFAIQKELGRSARDFLCEVGGAAEPACHFKFMRRVDILVSSIGALKWRGNLPPKEAGITGRRKLTRRYLDVLEQYWSGKSLTQTDVETEEIRERLFSLLGPHDDLKKWLVACLWKNIKDQTVYSAYPMKRWVEFVRIGEDYIQELAAKGA